MVWNREHNRLYMKRPGKRESSEEVMAAVHVRNNEFTLELANGAERKESILLRRQATRKMKYFSNLYSYLQSLRLFISLPPHPH